MICDGVTDLVNVLINIYNEKDETKKVYLIAFFGRCRTHVLVYFDAQDVYRRG